MPTALDRLDEMNELIRQLLRLDEAALRTALDEGFDARRPEWTGGLSKEYWASVVLDAMLQNCTRLKERAVPPGRRVEIRAGVKVHDVVIRPLTPEERADLETRGKGTS